MSTWKPIPEGNLSRARLAVLGIGSLGGLIQITQLGNPLRSPEYIRLSAASILLLTAIFVFAYRTSRAPWWATAILPVLVTVGSSGLKDPLAGTALAVSTAMVMSLYGSTPGWFIRMIGAMVAVPAAVAISPDSAGRMLSWQSATVLSIMPQILLIASMMRGIHLALRRQERTAEREALLARSGRAMLGVTDVGAIREIGRATGEKLVALEPGLALLIIRRSPDGRLILANLAGAPAGLRGRLMNEDLVTDPAVLAAVVPGRSHWHVESLGAAPSIPDRYLAVGGRRRVPTEVLDTFRNLSHQVMLGETGCHAHAELEHAAHHDHLTQLPTRAKFLGALGEALATATSATVALLNIDLDDFKQVNDAHGHIAGDELLVRVGTALTEAAAGRGLAGRFGGDEFALLLTDLADPAEALEVGRTLVARLAAPMALTIGTVTVGASIGVAVAEPGITVAELSRRADIAMYSAKASGKNRIDTYAPAREPLPGPGRLIGTGPATVAGFLQ